MHKKLVLITGGTRGLGAFLANRFWLAGYSLAIVARNEDEIRNLFNDLPKRYEQKALSFPCDLTSPEQVAKLIQDIKNISPQLKVLINNAAVQGPIGLLFDNNFSAWQQAIQVNLLAPVALCRGLIPLITTSGGGTIINLSGGGATGPRANFSAYATAKAGLVRFSETIAEELRPSSIRVNCIAPGAMKTDMLAEVLSKAHEAGEKEHSLASKVFEEGGASMERVADLALFLASDASNGITGKLISAVWDDWEHWPDHLSELSSSDAYTLRRITGRDRGFAWGDK
jgi:NAD(P)-dependent dehydrogenase (short-subunit alcohol dehydrogenase family)